MRTVKYKFDLDQWVKTPFKKLGIISMLGYDEGGSQYYVNTGDDKTSRWFKESMLEVASPIEAELL